jgi:enediyne polyketide synthase
VELEVEFELRPERDAYVREHNYRESLLLPAVVGMEAMARVAAAALELPGREPPSGRPAIRAARFGRPIVVPESGRKVRVHAVVEEAAGPPRIHVTMRSAVTDFKTDHFACDVVWEGDGLAEEREVPDWPPAIPLAPRDGLYGTLLFQGPMFQNLLAYHSLSSTSCQAVIRIPGGDPTGLGPTLLGAPEVRDAFLHSIQPCVPEFRILPVSIDSIRTRGFGAGALYLTAVERLREGRDFVYDVQVRDGEGRLVEAMDGFRCRSLDRFEDQPTLAYVRRMHALSAAGPPPQEMGA